MPSPQTLSAASQLILNVDDSDAVRYARSRALTQAGYRIIEASSGEEALLMASTLQPRLLVLDIQLPGIDGLEVCRRIKADPATAHMMVLQVSAARGDRLDRVAGLERGADAYLVEPIDPLELVATVRALLRLADREAENLRLIRRLSRTERQFIEATEAAECGLWDWDIPTGKLEWFGAHERLAGIAPGGFSGKMEAFTQVLHPDDRARVWEKLHDMMARRDEHFADEYRFIHPDGSVHWMAAVGRFFYDASGTAVRMTGVVQDVTARKEAEERLQVQHERLQLLAQASEHLLTAEDPGAMMSDVFETVQRHLRLDGFFNYRVDEGSGEMVLEACAGVPDELAGVLSRRPIGQALWGTAAATVQPVIAERLHESQDARAEAVKALGFRAYVCHPLRVGDRLLGTLSFASKGRDRFEPGDIDFMQTMCRYVAAAMERLRVQREAHERAKRLAKSEETLVRAQRAAKAGVWDIDLLTNRVIWCESYYDLYGLPRTIEPSHDAWIESVHPDDRVRVEAEFRRAVEGKGEQAIEFRIVGGDGRVRWLHSQGEVSCDDSGRAVRMAGITYEITERKEAERKLRESEEFIRRITHVAPSILYVYDLAERRHVWGNREMFSGLGYSRAQLDAMGGKLLETLIHPDDWPRYRAHGDRLSRLADGEVAEFEYRMRHADGRWLWRLSRDMVFQRADDGRVTQIAGAALDVTRRKNAEADLARFASLADHSNAFIGMCDLDYRPFYVNEAGLRLVGLDSLQDALRTPVQQFFYPEDQPFVVKEFFPRVLREGQAEVEIRFRHFKTGAPIWMIYNVSHIEDQDGRPIGLATFSQNITARKGVETALHERERFVRSLIETAPSTIYIYDILAGRNVYTNPGATASLGYTDADIQRMGGRFLQHVMHPDDHRRMQDHVGRLADLADGATLEFEYRMRTKDGVWRWFLSRDTVYRRLADGRVQEILGTAADITHRKEAEGTLRESEERLRLALDGADMGSWDVDLRSGRAAWNRRHAALQGYAEEDRAHTMEQWRDRIHPDDLDRVLAAAEQAKRERMPFTVEHRVRLTERDKVRWLSLYGRYTYDDAGEAVRFSGVSLDITERKQAEAAVEDREERLRILVNGVRDYAIFMLDTEGRVSSWNEGAARLLGYHTEEVLGMPQLRFYPEEAVAADQPARDLQAAAAAAAAASGRYEKDEWRVRQDGSRFLANTIVTALRNEDDSLRGYAVVMRDITERRAHEAALTEQARLLDLSNDAIIVRDKDDRIRYWNHGAHELYGWTDDEAVGKIAYELLQTEFAEPLERIVEHFHRDNRWSGEVTQRTRDGRRITVSTRWSLDRDAEGRPASVLVTNTDITERRRAEEAVRERERFLSTVTSAARVGLVMVEEGYVYRFANDAYAAIFDLPMQRLVGRHVYELLPDAWTHIQPRLDRAFAGEHVSYELTVPPRAGESHERFYAVSYEPHVAQDGRRTVIVVVVDITERRRAEGEVRESEERLRAILDRAPAVIFIKDRDGRSLFMNEECARVLDVDRDGATGKTEYELFPEALAEQFRAHDLAVWKSGNAQTLEEHVPQVDGVHTFLAQKFLLRDAEGAPYALCGIATDITPRRRMEDALRENEQRLQVLTTAMPQLVWACSSEGACIFQSPQWETVTGQPVHESLGYGWAEMIHPDDRSRTAAEWQQAVERGAASYRTEYRLRSREGGYRWYLARAEALHDEAGGVLQWIGTSTDITDRMQAEEELRRYKDELEVRVGERTQELQASQERLRELASQLTMTEQRERQKIARDLHDYLAQMLVVGRMKMGSVKKQPGLAPATVSVLGDVDTIFQQALTYTRTLIGELSPPSLRDYGLPAALRWLSERMQKDGLWVEVLADREQVPLSEEHAVVLFQCVRELLFNVLKHAGTDRATVQVTVEEQGGVRLSVHDRGRGFSPDALRRATEPGHLGLFAVRERMESIGGRMAIHTAPGHGATVTLVGPGGRERAESERAEGRD